MENNSIPCVVSGSFQCKSEIDRTIIELQNSGYNVLAPNLGWIYIHKYQGLILPPKHIIRPLPGETSMSTLQIENSFLQCLRISRFVYVVNPNGYVGNSVSLEMGCALRWGIPVFLQNPIDLTLDIDPMWQNLVENLPVVNINEISQNL